MLFTLLVFLGLILAAGVMCFLLVEIDRRIRAWFDYDLIHRQSMGEINGADIIQALKKSDPAGKGGPTGSGE
jgi:hypothetical protein